MIRSGETDATVEAMFELEGEAALERLPDRDRAQRELLVRRLIAEGGRSRVTIDGELATVQNLGRIGAVLVQVYGQHEQQSLLRPEGHREILDRYARLEPELSEYHQAWDKTTSLRARMDELDRRERERADLLDLARFRISELEKAALVAGEDEALAAERSVLANASKLARAATEVEAMLYGAEGAAVDAVTSAQACLAEAERLDVKLKEPLEMIRTARINLEEAARTLSGYVQKVEADPRRLEQVEARIQELNQLKRKYGGSLASAIATLERSRTEMAELEGVTESKAQAQRDLTAALDGLTERAVQLTAHRKQASADLKRRMEAELKTLGMRSPAFEPRLEVLNGEEGTFTHREIALGPAGADTVEYYIAPNLGQPAMPLARIASGGELSRVMLALKRLEAQRRGIATMIFDEVDAGIGGAVATVVGRKLKQLAKFHQILCVTHLPQIAAFADRHFVVEKEERRRSTRSRVTQLDEAHRAHEIARMLGGEGSSDKFLRAAKELLERAHE
jgi:DNA repair protein RecN (Recombination protein N)